MNKRPTYSILALLIFIFIFVSSMFLMAMGEKPSSRNLIHLRSGTIDTSQEAPDIPSGLTLMGLSLEDQAYYIVQFKGPIEEDWKKAVEDAGGTFFGYIPNFAFIVKMDGRTKARIQAMEFVHWIGLYRPPYKIDPTIMETYSTAEPSESVTLNVVIFKGEDAKKVAHRIEEMGGTILDISESEWKGKIKVRIESSRIPEIGTIPEVNWVGPAPVFRLFNNRSADIMSVRNVWDTHSLHGSGQVVAVADSGLDQGSANPLLLHDDFENGAGVTRVIQLIDRVGDGASDVNSGHGTHVSGSVLGNGDLSGSTPATHTYPNTCYAGMAPEASLVMQAVENNATQALEGIPSDLNILFGEAEAAGAHIHTNSWGYYYSAGQYLDDSQEVDEYMWSHKNFLILFAAGNDGVDAGSDGVIDLGSVSSPSTAKNCISVGATEGNRPTGSIPTPGLDSTWGTAWPMDYPADPINSDHVSDNIAGMAAFSGRGPCLDTRIKPDVVAPGTNIVSARSFLAMGSGWGDVDANYRWMGGTSMATPLVAGTCALIRQFYTDVQGITPSAALIKATLINGATDISPGQYGIGVTQEIPDPPRPNNVEGWGRVNVENSIFPTAPRVLQYLDETSSLSTGDRRVVTFQNNSGALLSVTLVWTDYPSTPAAGFNLVNDLNFTLTDPGSTIHYPNGLAGVDGINNVEVIDIAGPAVGLYTIIIAAGNIPQGPQPFAVVACGDIGSWTVRYPPNAPTGLGATAVSGSQIDLSWTDNSTDENGFRIERRTGGAGSFSEIDAVAADTIVYNDTTVSAGQLYSYRVRAFSFYGNSDYSNESAAATPGGSFGKTGGSAGGPCFIATAAYGSRHGDYIDFLRAFRDRYLMGHSIGKKWVTLYYRYSPPVAGFIADHPEMRKGIRLALFPFVAFSAGMTQTTTLQKGFILCLIVGFLLGMVLLFKGRKAERWVSLIDPS